MMKYCNSGSPWACTDIADHDTKKYDSKLAALWIFIGVQKVKKRADILKMYYFDTLWAYLDMPDHAHQKYENQIAALTALYSHA